MANTSPLTRAVSGLFPTLNNKIHGSYILLSGLHLASLCAFLVATLFPELKTFCLGAGGGLFFLSIVISFTFSRSIKGGVSDITAEIASLFSSIEHGKADLTREQRTLTHPDAQKISDRYEIFLSTIRKLVDEIRKIGVNIAVDSTQVAATVSDTTGKTAQQMTISKIVAAASNEANKAISDVTQNAQHVSEKTTNNLAMARDSYNELTEVMLKIEKINETVTSFINTVEELGNSSSSILGIVNIINSISEQTHLLSLNATIEAARAGEHGRGFAVVAEEVRDLARRIKPATEEITENINGMISIVEKTQSETSEILKYAQETDSVVGQATSHFHNLISDFEVTDEQLLKIAAAMEELSISNTDITVKVDEINSLSQDIAGDMASSGNSVSDLNRVTEKMLEMVSSFKTGEGTFDWLIDKAEEARDVFEKGIQKLKDQGVNVFDNNYKEVPNTEPQKYTAAFTAAFEKEMIPIFDASKSRIANTIYVLAIDRNGYLPAHHGEYSKPMTGDPRVDLLNSRHQRIFMGGESERRRCTHTEKMLMQTYMRDTGQILNDLSMPIYIDGRHWGALIIGFDPKVMFKD